MRCGDTATNRSVHSFLIPDQYSFTSFIIHTGKSQAKTSKSESSSTETKNTVQDKGTIKKKSTKKASNQQENEIKGDSTAQQGLAVLKNLIAKAAAGTLGSKSSSTSKTQVETNIDEPKLTPKSSPVMTPNQLKVTTPSLVETSTKCTMEVQTETTSFGTSSTGTTTKDEAVGQEIDYWLEEKLKMQNAPAYQSFQKGAQMKKNLTTSKGTSPPPQTISTQVTNSNIISNKQQQVT